MSWYRVAPAGDVLSMGLFSEGVAAHMVLEKRVAKTKHVVLRVQYCSTGYYTTTLWFLQQYLMMTPTRLLLGFAENPGSTRASLRENIRAVYRTSPICHRAFRNYQKIAAKNMCSNIFQI